LFSYVWPLIQDLNQYFGQKNIMEQEQSIVTKNFKDNLIQIKTFEIGHCDTQ
jgi:hypothetical protein